MVASVSGWFPVPSVASTRRVATERLAMSIVEAGSGPPVLLIHGLGWDHSLWNPTVERLAKRCHAIAADTRGHGATDKPDGPYDMEMLARDYAALADALGLAGICVIGLSQGGMVAQRLALLRPDLVRALVLISTACKSAPSLRDNMEARIAAIRASMLSRSDDADLHEDEISTSEETRSGRSSARFCATMPPCDSPMTQMPVSPRASASAAVSRANIAMS
jgi:pimeloyl-ACP methyl ester carboxylesterase